MVRRIDWAQVLADLRGTGVVLRQITRATGISKPTLLLLRGDHDLKMQTGELLLALWAEVTGRGLADVPRRGEPCSAMKTTYVDSWASGTIHCPLCGTHHPCRDKKR
jgi:lambda repressor-like predicted transcriptional regulator